MSPRECGHGVAPSTIDTFCRTMAAVLVQSLLLCATAAATAAWLGLLARSSAREKPPRRRRAVRGGEGLRFAPNQLKVSIVTVDGTQVFASNDIGTSLDQSGQALIDARFLESLPSYGKGELAGLRACSISGCYLPFCAGAGVECHATVLGQVRARILQNTTSCGLSVPRSLPRTQICAPPPRVRCRPG